MLNSIKNGQSYTKGSTTNEAVNGKSTSRLDYSLYGNDQKKDYTYDQVG